MSPNGSRSELFFFPWDNYPRCIRHSTTYQHLHFSDMTPERKCRHLVIRNLHKVVVWLDQEKVQYCHFVYEKSLYASQQPTCTQGYAAKTGFDILSMQWL